MFVCRWHLPWDTKADLLSDFMSRLLRSGYNHAYRASILESVLTGYERQLQKASEPGGRSMHRLDSYRREERAKAKVAAKRVRSAGHVSQLLMRDTTSPLYKHAVNHHNSTVDLGMFDMRIATRHKDPLSRQICEGVPIKNATNPLLNSRSEFRQPKVTRVTMERNLGEAPMPTPAAGPRAAALQAPDPTVPASLPTTHQGPYRLRTRGGGRTPPHFLKNPRHRDGGHPPPQFQIRLLYWGTYPPPLIADQAYLLEDSQFHQDGFTCHYVLQIFQSV